LKNARKYSISTVPIKFKAVSRTAAVQSTLEDHNCHSIVPSVVWSTKQSVVFPQRVHILLFVRPYDIFYVLRWVQSKITCSFPSFQTS